MIRPTFKAKADESIDDIIGQNDSLGPKELILENLKDYDNEDVNKLAIDLYDLLSKDNIEDSEELITQFYEQHYKTKDSEDAEDEESSDDVQVTLNEGLK